MVIGPAISAFQQVARSTAPTSAPAVKATPGFDNAVTHAVDRVDGINKSADDALAALASGENVDLHGTMITLEEADIAMRTMVSVRDKAIAAYEQIMNMAV
jgi:flagellar hook-basal body complex protein FliE